ncbi:MAG TPA: glycosyltransferase family A protein [Ilumatobacteraceae bacterium]
MTIGLPVYNGEATVGAAIRSVLDQQYERLELIISDNASQDGTEEICREIARSDARVNYHRQPENMGLLNNYCYVLAHAGGEYFKWLGDDDVLHPSFIARCAAALDAEPSLLLVTTQQSYLLDDGSTETRPYGGVALRSDQPIERFEEALRLLNESRLLHDPLYALMRRTRVVPIRRTNVLCEDEIFAAKLALAGPLGHLAEVLSCRRSRPDVRLSALARRLDVPAWNAKMATTLQCRELFRAIAEAELTPSERRHARRAIARFYLRRQTGTAMHRSRKLARATAATLSPSWGGRRPDALCRRT